MWPTNKVEERSRSVGCAITFHCANLIAGPASARAKNIKKEGRCKKHAGKGGRRKGRKILCVPVFARTSSR